MKRWVKGSYVKFGPRKFRALPTELMNDSKDDPIWGWEEGDPPLENLDWCEDDDPKATLVTSIVHSGFRVDLPDGSGVLEAGPIHWPVIDIDLPCAWVPSTNGENGHFYINAPVSTEGLIEILEVLHKHGIVQSGYLHAAKARGYTAVRLPGIKKLPKVTN